MAVIQAVSISNGILALTGQPGAEDTYAEDIAHIQSWAPGMVVTLSTSVELYAAGAQNIGAELRERAMRWVHLPIEDGSVPDEAVERRWPDTSRAILSALGGGGRILVHCRAGIGRSGMVALRLMIEAGEAPEEALARLRSKRPGAVETKAQLAWAMAAKRAPAVFRRHPQQSGIGEGG